MPSTFIGVKRSTRNITEMTSTRIGPSVAMIDASIGLVCWIPTIRNSFLAIPISAAAATSFRISCLRTGSIGTKSIDAKASNAATPTASIVIA